MNIIEQLTYHENDQLTEWYELDDKVTRKFQKELVKFSNENPNEIKQYCTDTLPSEYSSLSIVYEALSEYSTDWHEFLFEEIQRVVNLAKNQRIKPSYLEVLSDIELEDIYSKDEAVYIKILNFITANLNTNNDNQFNIELLEIMDWYLIEFDEDDDISEAKNWINTIENLIQNGSFPVKIKARKVLKDVDGYNNPQSFFERFFGMFK